MSGDSPSYYSTKASIVCCASSGTLEKILQLHQRRITLLLLPGKCCCRDYFPGHSPFSSCSRKVIDHSLGSYHC